MFKKWANVLMASALSFISAYSFGTIPWFGNSAIFFGEPEFPKFE